jgi:hypothetical protein
MTARRMSIGIDAERLTDAGYGGRTVGDWAEFDGCAG